jgi:predicted RNA-binding Zn ribbon-like protein
VQERRANREVDTTPAAPGDLELVRAFLSLHDHEVGSSDSLPPAPGTIEWWLVDAGLLDSDVRASDEELGRAGDVLEDLRALVGEHMGGPHDPGAVERIDRATAAAGLAPRFADAALVPAAGGVRGAIGRVLAVAFLAQLDGSWARFKACANPECRAVFYDRSKNRSGRWCVMAECGNRAKVRAFRARERAGAG